MKLINQLLRRLWKDKFNTTINVVSIAFGLCTALFLALYIGYETGYDQHHEHVDDIYRVSSLWVTDTGEEGMAITPKALSSHLSEQCPDVLYAARLGVNMGDVLATIGDQEFAVNHYFNTDQSIQDIFTFEVIKGGQQIFDGPDQLAISRATALKWFGTINCLNQSVEIGGRTLLVGSVFEDFPGNVDLKIEVLSSEKFDNPYDWEMFAFYTYVRLKKTADPIRFNEFLDGVTEEYFKGETVVIKLVPNPLNRLHYESGFILDNPKGNKNYVRLAIAAWVIVIIITSVNISNFLVIGISTRLKEIAMRRLLGSSKSRLIIHFLAELTFFLVIGMVVAITLCQLGWAPYLELAQIEYDVNGQLQQLIGLVFVHNLLLLILASYPLLFVLHPQPINALRKMVFVNLPGAQLRSIAVVIQFALAGISLTALLLFNKQLEYMLSADQGLDLEQVYNIQLSEDLGNREFYENQLANSSLFESVTFSGFGGAPGQEGSFHEARLVSQIAPKVMTNLFEVDSTYFEFFDLKLLSRPNQFLDSKPENGYAIINEAFLKFCPDETPQSVVGKELEIPWFSKTTVLGVVKDYHYQSLHHSIAPLIMFVTNYQNISDVPPANYLVRTNNRNAMKEFEHPLIEISNVSQQIEAQYGSEERLVSLMKFSSAICVVIAFLGLVGIITNMLKVRLYEITLRKVLGASLWSICKISLRYFLRLVAFAGILVVFASEYLFSLFKEMYAYHLQINFIEKLIPACLFFVMGMMIVGAMTVWFGNKNTITALHSD